MLTVNLDKARHDLGTSAAGRTDYRVFTCLTEYMNGNGVSTVPQTVISQETGFRRRTVSNSIHRLAEKGFLTIEKDTTGYRGIPSNIYHINPKYLTHAEPVEQSNTETPSRVPDYRNVYTIDSRFLHPMPAACYQGGPHVVPDYLSGWKLVTDDGEHEGVSYASNRTINPRLSTGDVRRLARLSEVLDDVVHDLLALYEEKNK